MDGGLGGGRSLKQGNLASKEKVRDRADWTIADVPAQKQKKYGLELSQAILASYVFLLTKHLCFKKYFQSKCYKVFLNFEST